VRVSSLIPSARLVRSRAATTSSWPTSPPGGCSWTR
jgi:hypothetical protein